MTLFRNLLLWIALAVIGAGLAWMLVGGDHGQVLVRYGGYDYRTTLVNAIAITLAVILVLWLAWWLLSLPFRTWHERRDQRARASLGDGLEALHQGRYAQADKLLMAPGRTAAQVFERARTGKGRAFDLEATVVIEGGTRIEALDSHNVIGRLAGSDPALAGEHVVHTAHLDHVGIIGLNDGDAIHHGAIDNALGVAILLETAQAMTAAEAPRRSQLFAALTGEEQGLLGAQHFVAHPTVPRAGLVANINIDMPVLLAPSTDAVAIGAEHSTLEEAVAAAAEEVGVKLSPDPFPEEVTFVRSDQYAFVHAGIPAVYLDGGVESADGERDPRLALTWFLRNCYHQPCDDATQPIQYDDAARLSRLSAALATRIGNDDARPSWKPGDFFGERFGSRP